MDSSATTTFETTARPEAVTAGVHEVVAENKHRPGQQSPDGRTITFVTRKTMLSWELDARVLVTPTAGGSRVELTVDTLPGRRKALLDGKKNARSAEKLAEQIRSATA